MEETTRTPAEKAKMLRTGVSINAVVGVAVAVIAPYSILTVLADQRAVNAAVKLAWEGTTTQASVVEVRRDGGRHVRGDAVSFYRPVFRFTPQGQGAPITAPGATTVTDPASYPVGSTLPVRYARSGPEVVAPANGNALWEQGGLMLLISVINFTLLGSFGIGIHVWLRRQLAALEGRAR
ncbi:MAG: DUF3592 domain-containing protein [Candidatus Sericytochromatia bacterium]|nr:DUF3592 domain-containing protein [Candidatus Sericytochromatia bacterium]